MKDINLLQEFHKGKQQFDITKSAQRAVVAFAVMMVLLLGCFGTLLIANHVYQQKGQELRTEMLQYSAVTETKNAAAQKRAQISDMEEIVAAAGQSSYVNTNFLWTLSSALNSNTFFTTVVMNENGTMTISGKGATRSDITYCVYTLKKTGLFSDISFTMVNTQSIGDDTASVYDFTVTAAVAGGAGVE